MCGLLSQDEQHDGKAFPFILGGSKSCGVRLRRAGANAVRLGLGRSGFISQRTILGLGGNQV